jgi:drug/metabolite transporter (DMT)-like permease
VLIQKRVEDLLTVALCAVIGIVFVLSAFNNTRKQKIGVLILQFCAVLFTIAYDVQGGS